MSVLTTSRPFLPKVKSPNVSIDHPSPVLVTAKPFSQYLAPLGSKYLKNVEKSWNKNKGKILCVIAFCFFCLHVLAMPASPKARHPQTPSTFSTRITDAGIATRHPLRRSLYKMLKRKKTSKNNHKTCLRQTCDQVPFIVGGQFFRFFVGPPGGCASSRLDHGLKV